MARVRDILTHAARGLAWVAVFSLLSLPAAAHGATLMVSWVPNTEEDLAGYEIYYGTASGQYTDVVDVPKDQLVPLGGILRYWLEDLEPRTTYYVALTAYDYWDNVSDFSEEAWCNTAASGSRGAGETGAGAGGCFLATAAYGSPAERHVAALRGLRDDLLLKSQLGRAFVGLYYSYSPSLAAFVAARGWLQAALRPLLCPLVGLAAFLKLSLALRVLLISLLACTVLPGRLTRLTSRRTG